MVTSYDIPIDAVLFDGTIVWRRELPEIPESLVECMMIDVATYIAREEGR